MFRQDSDHGSGSPSDKLLLAGGVALIATVAVLFGASRRVPACMAGGLPDLEFARTIDRVDHLVGRCGPFERNEIRDGLFIRLGGLCLHASAAWWLCRRVFARLPPRTPTGRAVFALAVLAAPAAAGLQAASTLLLAGLVGVSSGADRYAAMNLAVSISKDLLLAASTLVVLSALGRLVRSVVRTARRGRRNRRTHDQPPVEGPGRLYRPKRPGDAWDCASDVPDVDNEGGLGIALSGGGIRSATFGMGALQALQETPEGTSGSWLSRARWISAVSGGSYLAGSRQMLAAQGRPNPFRAGSHEVEHVRRHGRYLADTASEWAAAVAVIVAGLIVNLGVLWLLLFAIARPIGWLHAEIWPRSVIVAGRRPLDDPALWLAVAVPGLLAVLLLLAAVVIGRPSHADEPFRRDWVLWRTAGLFAAVAVASAAIALLVPLSDVIGTELTHTGGGEPAAAGTVGLLTALLSFTRRAARLRSSPDRSERTDDKAATGSSARHRVFVFVVTRVVRGAAAVVLGLLVLVLFADLVHDAARHGAGGRSQVLNVVTLPERLWLAIVVGILAGLWLCADQTNWSLHPLYKRRLARAFALAPDKNRVQERRYDQPTPLATCAARPTGEPELVICAAANVSDGDVAPPGRRAVSFTFGASWVGGPQIGYVPTPAFVRALGPKRWGDTTLLAAMAISGAAFASAMGRHSRRGLQPLLAVANLRLGVWLPSPTYVDEVVQGQAPPIRVRPFTYLLREIFGIYSSEDRLLYVTDGGHYENLGLVELLRRRCATVVCFDASGGPGTLLEAIRLAYEELGVTVTIDKEAVSAVRTPAENGRPPAETDTPDPLAPRRADTEVLEGTIMYRDRPPGRLIYGRAVLAGDTPHLVASYARDERRFPHDSTGDQWFDVEQFNNYLLLGRHVGQHVAGLLTHPPTPSSPPPAGATTPGPQPGGAPNASDEVIVRGAAPVPSGV